MPPRRDLPLPAPAHDRRGRDAVELAGHRANAAELLEDAGHPAISANERLGNHNRTIRVRQSHSHVLCDFRIQPAMDAAKIIEELKRLKVPHQEIAKVIGRERSAATKLVNNERRMQLSEVEPLMTLLQSYEQPMRHMGNTPDLPEGDPNVEYVPIEVLPSFAGMGGGGTGEGDRELALLPRRLVHEELRAKPEDLLMINVRGDSMVDPTTGRGFVHGDQLVIDRRDRNPVQPGPFALWFDDGYVVKNVERIRSSGKLRIFSNNPAYSDDEAEPDDVVIMGRPVWFARRI